MPDAEKVIAHLQAENTALRQHLETFKAVQAAHAQTENALRASEAHQRQLAKEQAVLANIGQIIGAALSINDIYAVVAEEVQTLFPFDRLTISLVDLESRIITNTYVAGVDISGRRTEEIIPFAGTMTEKTVLERVGYLFHPESDGVVSQEMPGLLPLYHGGLRSFLSVPLISYDRVIGVLQAQSLTPNIYTTYELQLLERVSAQIAGMIERTQLYAERQQAEEALREREAELHQMQKMEAIGTLAGGIAHEFNNILTAILGFTSLTLDDVPRGEKAWLNLHEVLKAGNRAKDLVQQLLTFSRPSMHEREPVSLVKVVEEAMPLIRAMLPATVEMHRDFSSDAAMVLANRTQLHQVVFNLCANAEHAMRENGGVLELSVRTIEINAANAASHPQLAPGSYVRFSIRDTGHGIAPELRHCIFEPFFTTKGADEGSGMGLAIVHGIIASYSGTVTVEGTQGEGSLFTIYLPQIMTTTPPERTPEPLETIAPKGQGRILFVDDEEMLARLGRGLLEHLGYQVVTHTSSLDALNAFRNDPYGYDLVVTDQTMPRMTGATLVEALRAIRPDIPIVLCTGFSHLMSVEKAQALGVDAFVMKPGVTLELAETIQRILEERANEIR